MYIAAENIRQGRDGGHQSQQQIMPQFPTEGRTEDQKKAHFTRNKVYDVIVQFQGEKRVYKMYDWPKLGVL